MSDRNQIQECLFSAVAELNEQRASDEQLPQAEETAVTGPNANLDSLGFLNLVMAIESKVADLGEPVSVAECLMSGDAANAPETIGDLIDLIAQLQDA